MVKSQSTKVVRAKKEKEEMKYIMLEGVNSSNQKQKVPIIFPNFMIHQLVAKYITHALIRDHEFAEVKVVSAGEVNLDVSYTGGESETCKVKALPEDASIINTYNYFHGIES